MLKSSSSYKRVQLTAESSACKGKPTKWTKVMESDNSSTCTGSSQTTFTYTQKLSSVVVYSYSYAYALVLAIGHFRASMDARFPWPSVLSRLVGRVRIYMNSYIYTCHIMISDISLKSLSVVNIYH